MRGFERLGGLDGRMAKRRIENLLRRDLTIWVVAVGVALAVASLALWPSAVQADEHSAMRSFSEASVAPGSEIEVTLDVAGYGALGQVVETIPDGFTYVSTSLDGQDSVSGQTVTFSLLGDESFTYTVTAASAAGTYSFEGVIKDVDRDERMVGEIRRSRSRAKRWKQRLPGPCPPTKSSLKMTRWLMWWLR